MRIKGHILQSAERVLRCWLPLISIDSCMQGGWMEECVCACVWNQRTLCEPLFGVQPSTLSQDDSQMLGLWSYLMQKEKKEYSCFGFDLAHVMKVPIASDPAGRSKDLL